MKSERDRSIVEQFLTTFSRGCIGADFTSISLLRSIVRTISVWLPIAVNEMYFLPFSRGKLYEITKIQRSV